MDPQMFTTGLLITTKTRNSPGVRQVNTYIMEHTQQKSKRLLCNSLENTQWKDPIPRGHMHPGFICRASSRW